MNKLIGRSLCRNIYYYASFNTSTLLYNHTQSFHTSTLLLKRNRTRSKHIDPVVIKHVKSKKETVELYENMTIIEIATAFGKSIDEISDSLIELNESNMKYLDGNKPLDKALILDICSLYNVKPRFVFRPNESKLLENMSEERDVFPQPPAPDSECIRRAPVVTIMGHVDHGKTTLLDSLRNSSIVQSEFGGITQHVGAFSVQLQGSKKKVTFLDTPGHAAFKAMRERGAKATDIVVLVVAADDGVNEQTIESIKYAREANVPIVVAINKCDKPNADPAKTRRDLMQHDIVVEDMGGDVQVVEISALYGTNINALQEALLLQAELMDLKATSKGLVEGVVIEATTSQGIGKVCTMIVQRGIVKRGTVFVAGEAWGKVRSMTDEHLKSLKEAGPSTPVRISGWRDELPSPGEKILEVESEEKAQNVIEYRKMRAMERKAELEKDVIDSKRQADREQYMENRKKLLDRGIRYGSTYHLIERKEERKNGPKEKEEENAAVLKLMIRSDVDGTLEALLNVFDDYSSELCDLQIVDFGVGPPTENMIEIAAETGTLIYCFNTSIPAPIRVLAGSKGVEIEQHNVIYRFVESVKNRLSAKIPPKIQLKQIGEGHVLKEFLVSGSNRKKQPIAGCLVDWGIFNKNATFRIIRGTEVIFEGPVESLKCENQFVNEAKTKMEVGIALDDKTIRFKEDDTIEVLEKEIIPQEINWNPKGF